MEEDTFYDLARKSLERDSTPFDGMALARSEDLAEVPNEDSMLSNPMFSSTSKKVPTGVQKAKSLANDPSATGSDAFNDLLKAAVEEEKAKHIAYDEKIQALSRQVPKREQAEKQKHEARSQARAKADAAALRKLEDHLSRHVSGILALDQPKHARSNEVKILSKDIADEQKEQESRRAEESKYTALKKEREVQTSKEDEMAHEQMEKHIDRDVGNILSSVLTGSHHSAPVHPIQQSSVQKDEPVADSHVLVKEVKNYIDTEIRKEVKSVASVPKGRSDPEKVELAKLRADLLKGNFQDALAIAKTDTIPPQNPPMKYSSAQSKDTLAQRTLEKFQHLFGEMKKTR